MSYKKGKNKSKDNKKFDKAALIVAVVLTVLFIFYVRGGFDSLGKMLSKAKAAQNTQYTVTAVHPALR